MTSTNTSHSELKDPESTEITKKEIDGGYGWVVVFAAFLTTFSSWGSNATYGIYLSNYLEDDTFNGARLIDYAAIGGISFGTGLTFAPLINCYQGFVGTKPTILTGALFQFVGTILASFSTKLWQLYLTQGLLQSFGLALIFLPTLPLVSQWFTKKRVLANSLAVTGSGIGGLILTLSMQKLMNERGIRWALRTQSIISLCLNAIAILLIKDRSKHHNVKFTLYDIQCLRCSGVWLLNFYLVTCIIGYVIVMFTLANFTVSLGYTQDQGSIVSAILQVGFCIGRPLAGLAGHFVGPLNTAIVSYYACCLFALALWLPTRNYASAMAFAFVEGLFMGAIFSTVAPIIARLVGMSKLNVAFCMSWCCLGIAATCSELIGVALTNSSTVADNPDLYSHTTIFAGCMFFACATSLVLLRGYINARDRFLPVGDSNPLEIKIPFSDTFKYCLLSPRKKI